MAFGFFTSFRGYVIASLALTTAVVSHAVYMKRFFYRTMVYLSDSKVAILAASNMALVTVVLVWKTIQAIFLGPLRFREVERLHLRARDAIIECCLATTIFRDEVNVRYLAMIAVLFMLKSLHWLAKDRVDFLEEQPLTPASSHVRLVALVALLVTSVSYLVIQCVKGTIHASRGTMLILFVFEFTVLLIELISDVIRYVFHAIDLYLEGRWEGKGLFSFYSELVTELCQVCVYVVFFIYVTIFYTFPLHITREMYLSFLRFQRRLADFARYRRVVATMNEIFADATEEELAEGDRICIICREEMPTAKKLECGHMFHARCLQGWLKRQLTCPTCRASVDVSGNNSSNNASNNNNNEQQAAQQQPQQQQPPNNDGNANAPQQQQRTEANAALQQQPANDDVAANTPPQQDLHAARRQPQAQPEPTDRQQQPNPVHAANTQGVLRQANTLLNTVVNGFAAPGEGIPAGAGAMSQGPLPRMQELDRPTRYGEPGAPLPGPFGMHGRPGPLWQHGLPPHFAHHAEHAQHRLPPDHAQRLQALHPGAHGIHHGHRYPHTHLSGHTHMHGHVSAGALAAWQREVNELALARLQANAGEGRSDRASTTASAYAGRNDEASQGQSTARSEATGATTTQPASSAGPAAVQQTASVDRSETRETVLAQFDTSLGRPLADRNACQDLADVTRNTQTATGAASTTPMESRGVIDATRLPLQRLISIQEQIEVLRGEVQELILAATSTSTATNPTRTATQQIDSEDRPGSVSEHVEVASSNEEAFSTRVEAPRSDTDGSVPSSEVAQQDPQESESEAVAKSESESETLRRRRLEFLQRHS